MSCRAEDNLAVSGVRGRQLGFPLLRWVTLEPLEVELEGSQFAL